MMNFTKIPTLSSYRDWLEKAEHDLSMFEETYSVYNMANCFLSLNSLLDWIKIDDEAPKDLKELVKEKQKVMGKKKNILDFEELKNGDIDQSLNLVRMFCNHAKHGGKKGEFVEISMGARLPATLPTKFEYLSIGENCSIKAVDLLKNVIFFWKNIIYQTDNAAAEFKR